MISLASSTMNFTGRLQSDAPVSAAPMARHPSNLVPAPAFQPTNITASVFDMRHIAHRHLCTRSHKIKPGMRDWIVNRLRTPSVPSPVLVLPRTLVRAARGRHRSKPPLPVTASAPAQRAAHRRQPRQRHRITASPSPAVARSSRHHHVERASIIPRGQATGDTVGVSATGRPYSAPGARGYLRKEPPRPPGRADAKFSRRAVTCNRAVPSGVHIGGTSTGSYRRDLAGPVRLLS
jgi:hypothetical protein